MKGLYKAAVNHAPPPDQLTLERSMSERVALYRQVPPTGENILISVDPFQAEESVPKEDKIEWAVQKFRTNQYRVSYRIMLEHLWG